MIYKEITDEYYFWNWLKNSDNYSVNFSLEGAKAVYNYFDELSEDIGENISFDPIAWCVEFSEYDSVGDAWAEYGDEELDGDSIIEWFQDRTTVIELENGHIILGEF